MRVLTASALFTLLVCPPALAQVPEADLMAPIQKFVDAFNKGDNAAAAATHAAGLDLVIIDEVPPYAWHGAQAFQSWGAALEADAQKQGMTEPMVAISKPTRIETTGDAAYVVMPVVYSFKQRGTALREAAQATFVLKKGASGWLIHGWTWTGPKPTPAGPK
jgi:ketosteroid isomerase-like protein